MNFEQLQNVLTHIALGQQQQIVQRMNQFIRGIQVFDPSHQNVPQNPQLNVNANN